MSFVYHGNYVKYFEMGRIAWLKNKGISYKDMEDNLGIYPVDNASKTDFVMKNKYFTSFTVCTMNGMIVTC